MDEQAFLHDVSVRTNVNIESLKDLINNEKFMFLIKTAKPRDAILLIRATMPRVGLREAQMIVEAFSAEFK
ncbi:MAG TPA: hypothetical protein VMC62_05365 [Longilinea sp.]|nr:hypothetical protein [Longilinea sp.]